MEFINLVKLYHWTTRKYSEHKGTDALYEKLNEHVDTRLPTGKRFVLINTTSSVFIKKMKLFRAFLLSISFQPALMNLRDEILADVDQFTYILKNNYKN